MTDQFAVLTSNLNRKIAQKSRTSSGAQAELLETFLDFGGRHDGRNSIAGDRGTRSKLGQNSSVGGVSDGKSQLLEGILLGNSCMRGFSNVQ
jgi:hypothetical protein